MSDESVSASVAYSLAALTAKEVALLGPEAAMLATLRELGLPLAEGWVFRLDASAETFLRGMLNRLPRATDVDNTEAVRVRLRPFFRSTSFAARAAPIFEGVADVRSLDDARRSLAEVAECVSRMNLRDADGKRATFWMRAYVLEEEAAGSASSVDLDSGDPELVTVRVLNGPSWQFDRKTMRPVRLGEGELLPRLLTRVADLADRAQMALGHPVELDWVIADGRPVVVRVDQPKVRWRFSECHLRQVSLLSHDEGPIAPMAVDSLDKALGPEGASFDEARVVRLFARAYRRLDGSWRQREGREPFTEAMGRSVRAVRDLVAPLSEVRDFLRTLEGRLSAFDSDTLGEMDTMSLCRVVRERQRAVVEAESFLDRARKATAMVVAALESTVGVLPKDCVDALATFKRSKARRRLEVRLQALAARVEHAASLDELSNEERLMLSKWRTEFRGVRGLGLDIRAADYDGSDDVFWEALQESKTQRSVRIETARKAALRRLLATVRARPLGRSRVPLARSLAIVLRGLAVTKGQLADGLASAQSRLRVAVLMAGKRLVDTCVLDDAEDALFLNVHELHDALRNQPGAYAARVRLRREQDLRWRHFSPPTHIFARIQ